MTKEELAVQLTGHEYRQEISKTLEAEAKKSGLVVVFGASGGLLEMRGAWQETYDMCGGDELLLTQKGVWNEEACSDKCIHFRSAYQEAYRHGQLLEALWNEDGYSWAYRTTVPHVTFEIVDEGEKYCRGIVFAVADLRSDPTNTKVAPPWKRYRRTGLSEMRPYVVGEDLTGISVQSVDTPADGGMVARNPQNHADQWYVAPQYFRDNLESVEESVDG